MKLRVRHKLVISLAFSFLWVLFSAYVGQTWLHDMCAALGPIIGYTIFIGLALIPGWAMSFIIMSLMLDDRPIYGFTKAVDYPDISVLIAAYNEQDSIVETLKSICKQIYPMRVNIIVSNDGSTDNTATLVNQFIESKEYPHNFHINLIDSKNNAGKANALNLAFNSMKTDICVTVDADSYLYKNALRNVVAHLILGGDNIGAVAGTVLTRNARTNWVTAIQEWDYFHGISVIKRAQSMYGGTLVAQGAFSAYKRSAIDCAGGWKNTVGEDIVLTWGMRECGLKVGFSELAICFTNVPETVGQLIKQRTRWARGLIEAFKWYPAVIWRVKKNSPFIWYNMTFPLLDLVYLLAFIPGVLLALLFGNYLIAGMMTLLLLPLTAIGNFIFFNRQNKIFKKMKLKVRKNYTGFLVYVLFYQVFMAYASVLGYASEIIGTAKNWGTK